MSRVLKPCGTPAAFMRHKRHGDPECPTCRAAWNAYYRTWQRATYRIRAEGQWRTTTKTEGTAP